MFEALFTPLQIKSVVIRNRIMSTAHTSGAGEDGKPKEKYQRYQEEKARGGIGLTIIGGSTAVAPDTPGADMLHLDASTDDIVPYYQHLAERLHRHGAAAFGQLGHMGRRANWDNQHWLPPIAPSPIREPAHRAFPKQMEEWDFRRIVTAFAEAARRIRQGGLDGLELSATHGHLIDQFWSPRTNQRTDRYGGSLENRIRFSLDILDAVRAEVGDDFVVGFRISGDEMIDGGLEPAECIKIARLLVERGADYLSVLGGQAENLPAHELIFPNMSMPSAPYLSVAAAIRAAVQVPVFHAQRIADIATAARIIADGKVDMVAMTRAHLADPHIVRKLQEGRVDDIRPCVGANYCIDRLYSGGQAYCLHNAATGREQTMPHVVARATTVRRVVVVGAGPAGLEASRVCAERGHQVVLIERQDRMGGQVLLAGKVGWREGLVTIVRWLARQAERNGVDVRLGRVADRASVLREEPDVVIVATGGAPARPQFAGSELSVTAADILLERKAPAERVLLFDDNGGEAALSCAEFLAERGSRVEFVTADPHPGALLERTTRPTFLRRLYHSDVVFTPDYRLTRVYPEGNILVGVLSNEYTLREEEREIDQVVVDYGTTPCDELYFELKPLSRNLGELDLQALVDGRPQRIDANDDGRFDLFRIGDAVSSRNIHAAIYDALRLCKDL